MRRTCSSRFLSVCKVNDMRLKSIFFNRLAFFQVVLAITLTAGATSAQTSSFTYQGRLTDGGLSATGNYDLQFALWDSASGGAQIGSTLTLSTVAVSNGVFTVSLDFGASGFNGANRFLEIGARPSGGGSFTVLSPRQQVTATPYALRSASAGAADSATTAANATQLGGVAASQYVLTTDNRLNAANYVLNGTSQQTTTNFNISGNGTLGGTLSANAVNATTQYNIGGAAVLSANALTGSTFVGTQVSTAGSLNTIVGALAGKTNTGNNNVILGAQSGQVNTGTDNVMIGVLAGLSNSSGEENVFIGRSAGQNNTTGGFGIFIGSGAGANNLGSSNNVFVGGDAGIGTTTGGFNAFFGTSAGTSNTTGQSNTFVGEQSGRSNTTGSNNTALGLSAGPVVNNLTQSTAIGANATVSTSNTIVLGTNSETTQIPGKFTVAGVSTFNTNVGIGITPTFKLHVVDPGAAGLRVQTNSSGGAVASFGGNGDFQIDSNGVAGGRLIVQQGGNVGIGTDSPDNKLTVNGTADKPGGGSWGTFSDERLKNLKGSFTPGLSAVLRLQPLRYEYKRDNALGIKSEGEHIGFSAQAVQKVIPEAVSANDRGYLVVNNDPILWTMLNAIKEQQAQIEGLRRANASLTARLQNLEHRRRNKTVVDHRRNHSQARSPRTSLAYRL